jgi:DNA-binding response OmpR family regulator
MQLEKSRRILYIEDHDDTRELVTLLLAQQSYEVITGSTIASGVALAGTEKFDLYLLDSWLPDGSGLELCKRIRQFDKTKPIPNSRSTVAHKPISSNPASLPNFAIWSAT